MLIILAENIKNASSSNLTLMNTNTMKEINRFVDATYDINVDRLQEDVLYF